MEKKEIYKESNNLKEQANKIFNGLVVNAYYSVDPYPTENTQLSKWNEENNIRRDKYFNETLNVDLQKELNYDCEMIAFEFSNGAIVSFDNSEWAAMESLDRDKINLVK